MEKLILKSLETNSTTILPNFGAFMKMGKSFLFNEFLKYDDGKLAQVIADSKGIALDQAKEELRSWIEKLNSNLDSGKSLALDGVGEVTKEGGKLKFVAANSKPINETKEEPKAAPKPEVNPIKTPEPIIKEDKKTIVKEVTPTKEVLKPVVSANISTDFSAQDAINKIKDYTNKNELIAFTRDDKRKTVIEALNKRLDALNGKVVNDSGTVKETVKESLKENNKEVKPVVNEVTKIGDKPKVEVPKVHEDPKPVVKVENNTEAPKKVEPDKTEVNKVVPKVEPVSPKVDKINEKEKKEAVPQDKAIAAIAESVQKTEDQLKKRKRRKIILWLSIICLVAGGSVIGFLKKDLIMSYFDKKHEPKELADNTEDHQKEETEEVITDEIDNDEVQPEVINNEVEEVPDVVEDVPEVVKEEVVETVPEPVVTMNSSSKGSYHIIAGSFSSEDNANSKVKTLKSKGYSDAKVLGEYGGLYTVRAMSFESMEAAKKELINFKADGNKGFVKKI